MTTKKSIHHTPSTSSVFAALFEDVFGSFRIKPVQREEVGQQKKEDNE